MVNLSAYLRRFSLQSFEANANGREWCEMREERENVASNRNGRDRNASV